MEDDTADEQTATVCLYICFVRKSERTTSAERPGSVSMLRAYSAIWITIEILLK